MKDNKGEGGGEGERGRDGRTGGRGEAEKCERKVGISSSLLVNTHV